MSREQHVQVCLSLWTKWPVSDGETAVSSCRVDVLCAQCCGHVPLVISGLPDFFQLSCDSSKKRFVQQQQSVTKSLSNTSTSEFAFVTQQSLQIFWLKLGTLTPKGRLVWLRIRPSQVQHLLMPISATSLFNDRYTGERNLEIVCPVYEQAVSGERSKSVQDAGDFRFIL